MLLSTVAGFFVSLLMLSRQLIQIEDSAHKGPLILLVFAAITGGFAAAGWVFLGPPWALVPAGILLLVAAGEARRFAIRRFCAGSSPIGTIPHKVGYFRPFTTTDIVVHRFAVELATWHGSPLRIAQLTDLHVNMNLPGDYYRRAFDLAAECEPDLVVLTGDFVSKPDDVSALARVLRPCGKRGTFAVLGNHDYWSGAEAVRSAIRDAGLTLLTDNSVRVPMDGGAVQITGCDCPWGASPCTVPDPGDGIPRLVLSHTPDNIYRISRQSADIVFSGHCHAGQMRIPLLGSIVVPSVYGRRFDHGHFVVHGTHLFVASGIGTAGLPFRVYCQPDIFVVDVSGASGRRN
jgi:hypothetical protein